MAAPGVLEVIVCSEAEAVAAKRGGADRLEVISHYEAGGLTPQVELVQRIGEQTELPLRVMLRQCDTYVVKDDAEIEDLCSMARQLAGMGIDGIVLGFLEKRPGGLCIDHNLLSRVLACAPQVNATFHRAFDELEDPPKAITELKRHGQIDRILTNGRDSGAKKLDSLRDWQRAAGEEIELVIGGGTDADVVRLLKPIGIREFHVGRAVREGQSVDGAILVDRVRELADLVHG